MLKGDWTIGVPVYCHKILIELNNYLSGNSLDLGLTECWLHHLCTIHVDITYNGNNVGFIIHMFDFVIDVVNVYVFDKRLDMNRRMNLS